MSAKHLLAKVTSDSTKRALRTVLHVLIAVATAIPVAVPIIDSYSGAIPGGDKLAAFGGILIVWAGVVSKVINTAEDHGWIPAFLKVTPAPKD